eukprot:72_1
MMNMIFFFFFEFDTNVENLFLNMAQQVDFQNDEVIQQSYNKDTQEANIKQVYKVNATELSEQLYLGTQWQAHDTKTMTELGITHLISCFKDKWDFVNNLKALEETRVEITEMEADENKYSENTLPLNEILNNYLIPFLDIVCKKETNKIFIYCNSSVNHSPTIAVVMIMHLQKKNLKQAYDEVKRKHGKMMCVSKGWMKQLRELDKKLYGQYSTKDDALETKESKYAAILAKMKQTKLELAKEAENK